MTDPIETLLEEIRNSNDIQRVHFTKSFLNATAEVFVRYGFGATRSFLLEKRQRRDLLDQANGLLKTLELMSEHAEVRQRREIGRTIIKALVAIKDTGSGQAKLREKRR